MNTHKSEAVVILSSLLALSAASSELRGANSDSIRSQADAYSRAAKLKPLHSGDPNELRVWIDGANVFVALTGYIVRASSVTHCTVPESLTSQGTIIYGRNSCTERANASKARALLRSSPALSALDGKNEGCGLDGDVVVVDGLIDGQRFSLETSNPDLCKDPLSILVAGVLNGLTKGKWRAP